MNSWNPEAVEAALASQGIRLAPGRAVKIAAALNASADLVDPLLGALPFEADPTAFALALSRCSAK
ncbi:MAG: hypothetical protein EXR33_11665 [Betaproteobacteria bacterium]|nr:hypothetical protein [Betaproteobacteria bacterium]